MNEQEIIDYLISCQGTIERVVEEINKEFEDKELKVYLLKLLKKGNVNLKGKKVKFNRQKGAFIFRTKEDNRKSYTFASLEGWDGEYWKYDYLIYPLPEEVVEFMEVESRV